MTTNKVREHRERLGISQTRLACKAGIASPNLSKIELGKVEPWPKARRALARALGVPIAELFPEVNSHDNGSK